jgi:hypothetical protein
MRGKPMSDHYSLDERAGYLDGYADGASGRGKAVLLGTREGQEARDYEQGYWDGHCAGSESKAMSDYHVGPLFAREDSF